MTNPKILLSIAAAILCSACATKPPQSAQASPSAAAPGTPTGQVVKSRDGSFSGEVVGTPVAKSKFAKLQIGMQMKEVQELLDRTPDRFHTYESGKRWIPFYMGNDARRMQAFYKGEGCLIFADGSIFGGAGGDLLSIIHDASGACYQP